MKIIKPMFALLTLCLALDFTFAGDPTPQSASTRSVDACGVNGCDPATYDPACKCCATSRPGVANSSVKPKPVQVGRIVAPEPVQPATTRTRAVPAPRPVSINWESDIRRAAIRSAREGKPMLLNVSADWCHFCRQMKSETYTQRAVIEQLNDQFVAVDLDADANRELVQLLGIKSLPTILLVTPEINVVSTMNGFQSADALITRLNQVVPRSSKRTERPDDSVITVSREEHMVVE